MGLTVKGMAKFLRKRPSDLELTHWTHWTHWTLSRTHWTHTTHWTHWTHCSSQTHWTHWTHRTHRTPPMAVTQICPGQGAYSPLCPTCVLLSMGRASTCAWKRRRSGAPGTCRQP